MSERSFVEIPQANWMEERASELKKVIDLPSNLPYREKRAFFNQKLAMDFFKILSDQSADQLNVAKKFVDTLQEAVSDMDDRKYLWALQIIAGARAQAGTMDSLRRNGYSLIIPQSSKLVKYFDADRYVDFIVIRKSRGQIYFIDTRSQNQRESGQNKEINVEVLENNGGITSSILNLISESLQKTGQELPSYTLSSRNNFPYAFVIVTVPTGREFMDISGKLSEETGKQLLESLASVPTKRWA